MVKISFVKKVFYSVIFLLPSGIGGTCLACPEMEKTTSVTCSTEVRNTSIPLRYHSIWQRAEGGDVMAMLVCGDICLTGNGVRQDYAEALTWYRRSAQEGNAKAEWRIGYMYQFGKGVSPDLEEAANWYRKSASQEDPIGQWRLGTLYRHGKGVRQDLKEAIRLYSLAASQGDSYAQNDLGVM